MCACLHGGSLSGGLSVVPGSCLRCVVDGVLDIGAPQRGQMGGCQNYGPFWVPIIIRHLIFGAIKKGS